MRYTHFFFDMDGTVINSAPGVTNAVSHALRRLGIPPPPAKELTCFIGPPLVWSFAHYYGLDEEQTQQALAYYREYYSDKGIYECLVYEGVEALLQELTEAGATCVLATSKPHVFANRILAHFGLDRYFAYVSGPELDGTRNAKAEVISYAIEQMKLTDRERILMIGDRDHDTLGAGENGIDAVGVLWGFGSREELLESGAMAVYDSAVDLKKDIFAQE